ncbi:MAG: YbaK/prolyl-tRNA synthetase associated region [Frankiales bacterium]|nr:YbaK/prolyl-tRNA synthetase associated region [Frankiales bacterium]
MAPQTVELVTSALLAGDASGAPVLLPDAVRTAVQAAAALECEVGAIVNSLVFDAHGVPVLVLTSGAHRVDTAALAAHLGLGALDRATPDFVREHTGQPIGGVSPVGHRTRIDTYVDRWLAGHGVVWAAAGHPNWVFPTTFDELVRLTSGTAVDVA